MALSNFFKVSSGLSAQGKGRKIKLSFFSYSGLIIKPTYDHLEKEKFLKIDLGFSFSFAMSYF